MKPWRITSKEYIQRLWGCGKVDCGKKGKCSIREVKTTCVSFNGTLLLCLACHCPSYPKDVQSGDGKLEKHCLTLQYARQIMATIFFQVLNGVYFIMSFKYNKGCIPLKFLKTISKIRDKYMWIILLLGRWRRCSVLFSAC